ncbi:MAG: ATP-binding protein, partial [Pseudomonadota bacterium]|nr:ATP-binding protein [Pseudomonadota bacterium]
LKPPVDRMQSLIRDLLVLTQLESGDSAQAPQPVAMRTLIAQVAAELKDLRPSGDSIELELLSDAKVLGIEKELHSVCTNLVANALRYSAESDSVKVSWINTDNGQVRLKVDDKGLGIPQEHLNRITERFYRVDMADSTKRGGTGLGLAIVKHVLRRHNSKLNVTSKLGRGSTFYCDFTPYSVNTPTPSQPSN